ncbi:hypothetical protein HFO98_20640 [Rhizobium leguminosarum]|uniref:hypothetical protein n=1 Tax=Rhizobium leguminosarum TaxID=384 RepID=UPI001C964678|nr:hypothetical protein [Rhizobium leguminosarum]MBY5410829.1 hypothetical protein [Rhizobium leguminosarum]MBY5591844.1 hypothetical protein [Rhizobium leguminosarum]MBY5605755.1 hypothetical protein [Rhizobium leguminosarum]
MAGDVDKPFVDPTCRRRRAAQMMQDIPRYADDLCTTPYRIFVDATFVEAMLSDLARQEALRIQKSTINEKEGGAILGIGRSTWDHPAQTFGLAGKKVVVCD